MINSIKDLKNFVNDKNFKKVFFLCGEKSFTISGAKKIFEQIKKNKEVSIFLKKSHIPIYDELIEIIHFVQKFKPDLIIAIGGGATIDYAKIANVVEYRQDLKSNNKLFVPIWKNSQNLLSYQRLLDSSRSDLKCCNLY